MLLVEFHQLTSILAVQLPTHSPSLRGSAPPPHRPRKLDVW